MDCGLAIKLTRLSVLSLLESSGRMARSCKTITAHFLGIKKFPLQTFWPAAWVALI